MIRLTLENLSKNFFDDKKKIEVLKNISFEIKDQSLMTIIGPSGSGKSTLLRIIAGLIPQTSGRIIWSEPKPKLSFVFQSFGLMPFLNVFENIEFGLKMQGRKKTDRDKKVKELIEEVGLNGFEKKHPKELSGGMRQRVGIARALAIEPDLLLLDEPFSSLDELIAENLRKLLLKVWQQRQMTILMVTHLVAEAIEVSDQIIVLNPKNEKPISILDCELDRPRSMRTEKVFYLEDRLKSLITT